jgi:hypothetical protein
MRRGLFAAMYGAILLPPNALAQNEPRSCAEIKALINHASSHYAQLRDESSVEENPFTGGKTYQLRTVPTGIDYCQLEDAGSTELYCYVVKATDEKPSRYSEEQTKTLAASAVNVASMFAKCFGAPGEHVSYSRNKATYYNWHWDNVMAAPAAIVSFTFSYRVPPPAVALSGRDKLKADVEVYLLLETPK